ncbi:glycosyl hydrolase family 18 protein [Nocardioides sp. NPDC092400]|uniref:glycosyl hydrolase family 18 protein n=1 Tax=Nocardioides sp. NPDC092400 TaxID=3155196 RepID=UPI0034252DDE
MTRRPRLAAALAASILTAAGTAAGTAAAQPPLAVTGYVLASTPADVVERDAPALAALGVASVPISADGRDVRAPGELTRQLRRAHRHGLRAELLVSNYSDRLGGFDSRAARRLLRHEDRVRRVARQLADVVRRQGWDGITVDLESLSRADGRGLVRLVRELQARMPAERTVSVDLQPSPTVEGYRERGFRVGAIGRAADVVVVMAYDRHGPIWTGPGPIGPLRWQRSVVEAVLTEVPAAKVDLGVAGYGYTWPRRGEGRSLTVQRARRLVREDGARAVWKPTAGEWRARLSDGTVLWWSDTRSFRLREELAEELGVHGIALWRLGSAGPLA